MGDKKRAKLHLAGLQSKDDIQQRPAGKPARSRRRSTWQHLDTRRLGHHQGNVAYRFLKILKAADRYGDYAEDDAHQKGRNHDTASYEPKRKRPANRPEGCGGPPEGLRQGRRNHMTRPEAGTDTIRTDLEDYHGNERQAQEHHQKPSTTSTSTPTRPAAISWKAPSGPRASATRRTRGPTPGPAGPAPCSSPPPGSSSTRPCSYPGHPAHLVWKMATRNLEHPEYLPEAGRS